MKQALQRTKTKFEECTHTADDTALEWRCAGDNLLRQAVLITRPDCWHWQFLPRAYR
jgi:hypothetical protein